MRIPREIVRRKHLYDLPSKGTYRPRVVRPFEVRAIRSVASVIACSNWYHVSDCCPHQTPLLRQHQNKKSNGERSGDRVGHGAGPPLPIHLRGYSAVAPIPFPSQYPYKSAKIKIITWAVVAEQLACSPPTKASWGQSPAWSLPDFRIWESCRSIPLVDGFSRGYTVSSTLSFRRCSILKSITLIGSQVLAHSGLWFATNRPLGLGMYKGMSGNRHIFRTVLSYQSTPQFIAICTNSHQSSLILLSNSSQSLAVLLLNPQLSSTTLTNSHRSISKILCNPHQSATNALQLAPYAPQSAAHALQRAPRAPLSATPAP
ncbi:hypothetical protein PR048_011591 [Dryococelus australis]|uniref:Uncharacterized protein n=1 Tax=Dryococelus australis TaxID=614101 RepID=A0ABQ9HM10_9NEOP|nr:hypothetical protein PR048_011591 [Dryococelus australis]